MQNGSSRKSNVTRKTSMGIARRTLMLAAMAALGIASAGKSAWATTEQVQDFTKGSSGNWGTAGNWAGGAGATVPNNAGSTVYVIDTAAGGVGPVDLHGVSFTIAGIGNISGSTTELTGIGNTTGSATLIIDPNTLPIPAASTIASPILITTLGGATLTLQFGTNSNSNNQPGVLTITSTINATIAGHVSLTADGLDGNLNVTAANTYSGVTTIENGAVLSMSGAANIGAVALSGGSTFNVNNNIQITDLTSTSASDSIVLGSGDRLTATLTGNDTVAGVISGSGYFTLSGSHTLTLSNNNTYTGGTTINAGATLNVASTGSIEGAVTVYGGGTFDVNNTFGITDLSGGGNIVLGSDDTLTVSPTTADTFSGVISGSHGSLTIADGGGSLTLSGNNTYGDLTTVDSGSTLNVTGTIVGPVIDNGTLNVENNLPGITDLNGTNTSAVLDIFSGYTLSVDAHNSDTFSGILEGDDTTTLAVTAHHHGEEVFNGDMSGFSGVIALSDDGKLDISGAQNNLDVKYDNGYIVAFYVDFGNQINFGDHDSTLVTGEGALTPAQESEYSGYDVVNDKGEELSGNIILAADTHHATIDNDSDYTTLISGIIQNDLSGGDGRLILEGEGSESVFELTNDANSSDFTEGELEIHDATVKFDNIDQLPSADPVPIVLDGGTLHSTGDAGLVGDEDQNPGNAIANPIKLSYNGGTLDVGYSNGYDDYYYDANPVVYSGVIEADYPGSPGTLSLINSALYGGYEYYYGAIALTGVNTYSTATTIGSADGSGGYMLALAGNNSAFGSGSLTLENTGAVGTTNIIESGLSVGTGGWGATPIHITVSSFNASASDEGLDLAATGFATNITFSGGMYHLNNANASDNTNDAIVLPGSGNVDLGGELYLSTYAFGFSGPHPRPYDFSQYVVATTGSGGTVTGGFYYAEDDSYDYLHQTIQGNGAGGQEMVITIQTAFADFANNSNAYNVGHYIDTFATPGNEGNLSPALISALITLSQGSYAQVTQVLNELTAVDYASLGDQSIQNSTYESQQIFGQIDSAFSAGGFNTGGLALLKTSGSAPDPFSTALQASLDTSAQMAQNVASLSSVNFMDDTGGNGAGSPPVPQEETPESQLSGFVSGDIVMSTLPEGNALGQPHYTTGGVTAGIDYRLNENWVVGGYFNYGYTGATLDYLGSRQQSSSYSPGLFVGYENGPWYIDALGSYTYNDYRVDRNFSVPGGGTATGKPTSNQYDLASLVGFYVPAARNLQVGPAGGFAYTNVDVSSFSETGSPFDLNVSSHSVNSLRSLLGGQAKYTWTNSTMPLDVNFNAFWQHEFLNGGGGISAGLSNITGPGTFLFTSTGPTRDSALVGGGLSGEVTKNITVFANYESQIGDKDVFGQSIIAGLSVSFK